LQLQLLDNIRSKRVRALNQRAGELTGKQWEKPLQPDEVPLTPKRIRRRTLKACTSSKAIKISEIRLASHISKSTKQQVKLGSKGSDQTNASDDGNSQPTGQFSPCR